MHWLFISLAMWTLPDLPKEPAVSIADLRRLPPYWRVNEQLLVSRELLGVFRARASMDTSYPEKYDDLLSQARLTVSCWELLKDAHDYSDASCPDLCRSKLHSLRHLIGYRSYGAGKLPSMVPLWGVPIDHPLVTR